MTDLIYYYKGSHYCAGCIVPVLMEDPDVGRWAALNDFEPGEDAEADLDEIAEALHVLRPGADPDTFPTTTSEPPEPPTFCPGCLHFFSIPTLEDQ